MRVLLAIMVVTAYCAVLSQGFLFSSKNKPICEQHPCKNKGTCKPDAKNASAFTCACPDGFFGVKCEHKTGCQPKPCKKDSTCSNDKLNPADYHCKCKPTFVGKNCDTVDPCIKNPCKIGKCVISEKLKAECECPNGFTGSKCDKRNCTIVEYHGKHFSSKPKVYIDMALKEKFNKLDELAKLCNVKIKPIRSFSLQPDHKKNADNKDAPFFVGRGLEFEIHDAKDALLCNAVCLAKIPIPSPPAKCFVDGLQAIQFKWSILNPTVLHDGFHVANLLKYNEYKEHKQVGCKETKFH